MQSHFYAVFSALILLRTNGVNSVFIFNSVAFVLPDSIVESKTKKRCTRRKSPSGNCKKYVEIGNFFFFSIIQCKKGTQAEIQKCGEVSLFFCVSKAVGTSALFCNTLQNLKRELLLGLYRP